MFEFCLIAYIGPETILPLTSALAAIGGGVMLFWNSLRRIAARMLGRRTTSTSAAEQPIDAAR